MSVTLGTRAYAERAAEIAVAAIREHYAEKFLRSKPEGRPERTELLLPIMEFARAMALGHPLSGHQYQAIVEAEQEIQNLIAARAEVTRLRERNDALEKLLVCFRIGRAPSEKLHRELERTREALSATDTATGAHVG